MQIQVIELQQKNMELMEQSPTLRQTSTCQKNIVDTSTKYATLQLARANTAKSNQFVYFALPQFECCAFQFADNLIWLNNSRRVSHVIPRRLYGIHLWKFSTHDVGCLCDALMLSYFNLEVLQWHHNLGRLPSWMTPTKCITLRVAQGQGLKWQLRVVRERCEL